MATNLYQQLNPQNQQLNLAQLYKSANNPQALLTNLMSQNQQYKNIMQMINASGKSPKELFYQKAKEMGVDPNSILSQLR